MHGPGDVPLRNVGDFVRQDTGELVFVARGRDQARVNTDVAAWQSKRVDRRVVDDEEVEFVVAVVGMRGEPVADGLHILRDLGIVDDNALAANFAHDRPAKTCFLGAREHRIGRAADIRQANFRRRRSRSQGCQDGQQ